MAAQQHMYTAAAAYGSLEAAAYAQYPQYVAQVSVCISGYSLSVVSRIGFLEFVEYHASDRCYLLLIMPTLFTLNCVCELKIFCFHF